MKFEDGIKVRVIPHGEYPDGGTGRVRLPPSLLPNVLEKVLRVDDPFCSAHRTNKFNGRIVTWIWVEFDEPILDAEGDGPWTAGEVEMEYLEILE